MTYNPFNFEIELIAIKICFFLILFYSICRLFYVYSAVFFCCCCCFKYFLTILAEFLFSRYPTSFLFSPSLHLFLFPSICFYFLLSLFLSLPTTSLSLSLPSFPSPFLFLSHSLSFLLTHFLYAPLFKNQDMTPEKFQNFHLLT